VKGLSKIFFGQIVATINAVHHYEWFYANDPIFPFSFLPLASSEVLQGDG